MDPSEINGIVANLAAAYSRGEAWLHRTAALWEDSPALRNVDTEALYDVVRHWCDTQGEPPTISELLQGLDAMRRRDARAKPSGCEDCLGSGTRQVARAWVEYVGGHETERAYVYAARCTCAKGQSQSATIPTYEQLRQRWERSPQTRVFLCTDRHQPNIPCTWHSPPRPAPSKPAALLSQLQVGHSTDGRRAPAPGAGLPQDPAKRYRQASAELASMRERETEAKDAASNGQAGRRLAEAGTPMARHGSAPQTQPGATWAQQKHADSPGADQGYTREPGEDG